MYFAVAHFCIFVCSYDFECNMILSRVIVVIIIIINLMFACLCAVFCS